MMALITSVMQKLCKLPKYWLLNDGCLDDAYICDGLFDKDQNRPMKKQFPCVGNELVFFIISRKEESCSD